MVPIEQPVRRLKTDQADLSVRWAHVILLVLSFGGSNCLCVRCPVFESWSGYVLFPPVTFGGPCGGFVLGVRAAKGLSRQFQVDMVTNLIKQGEIVTERHCC